MFLLEYKSRLYIYIHENLVICLFLKLGAHCLKKRVAYSDTFPVF